MKSALPNAFLHPWNAPPKRSSSQALPAILDDDEETGSATCELPDPSGPGGMELLTSSGDEQWSVGGNEHECEADSGDQGFLEVGNASPVSLYSTSSGLRGGISALSLAHAPSAQASYEAASLKAFLSSAQLSDDTRACDAIPAHLGTRSPPSSPPQSPQLSPKQQLQQQQQQQRLSPVSPISFGSSRPPHQAKRGTPPRLAALVVDAAREPTASSSSSSRPASNEQTDRRTFASPKAALEPMPTWPPAASSPASPRQYNDARPPAPPPALHRERTRSLGRSRSVGINGSTLPPTGARQPLSPRSRPETTRVSESSILDLGAAAAAATRALSHSAPLHSQQNQEQQQQQQQQFAAPPGGQLQQPQPPGPGLGPFAASRRRTASQSQLRIPAPTQPGLPPAPPAASPDGGGGGSYQRPLATPHTPWWGLPPPGLGSGGGAAAAARLGAVSAQMGAAAAAAAPPPALAAGAPSGSPPGRQQPAPKLQSQLSPLQSHLSLAQQDPEKKQQQQQQQLVGSDLPHQHHHLQNAVSAPLLRLSDTAPVASLPPAGGGGGGFAAAAAAVGPEPALPSPPSRPAPGRAAAAAPPTTTAAAAPVLQGLVPPTRVLPAAVAARAARQSAPSLGRGLQLPGLNPAGGAAAAASASSGEGHTSGVGVLAGGAGGPAAVEVPAAPEVALRPPRWLKPSAFQVTEQLRSGRLQDLVDKLATVTCPTFFDLGGLEFSGSFHPAATASAADGAAAADGDLSGGAAAAAAAVAALGAVVAAPSRHQTLRASLNGIGVIPARSRYHRSPQHSGGGGDVGGGGGGGSHMQVLTIPRGQHITLYNATLLLTADQYILVGPGASLTLKGVEVLGCSREAARQSAAVRRRALSMAAAAAAASGAPSAAQQAVASAAIAAVTSTAASGYSKLIRRTSSPGRTTRDAGVYGMGSGGRRVSVSDGTVDGAGAGGMGLPPVRRRAITTTGGTPAMLSLALQGGQSTAPVVVQELVDPTEYVEEHGLIEVVGGYARISNCRLWPGRVQMALCVSDGGGCSLSYSTAGACCAAGQRSCLVSEQTTYDGGAAGCVSALHGARLGLTDCVLRYPDGMPKVAAVVAAAAAAAAADGSGSGVAAAGGGGCDLGIEARGSGTLAVLTDCDVTNGGVGAAMGARLYLQSIRVSDARGHGLLACDAGTALYVRDCRVDDSAGSAAVAIDGAAIRVADSTFAGSAAAGVVLAAAADAVVPPPPRCTVTLLRCDVSANAGHGAAVAGGGFLAVADSVLYNNLGCGVAVDGGGSVLSGVGMRIIRNEGHGVRAAGGAGTVLARCCAMGNGRDGVSVEGHGSRGHLTRCESRENRESGLCVTGSASVELSYTRLAANQHDGLAVGGDGSLAVGHGCVLNGNVAKGAVVCMGGASELTECAIHCNGSKSAQVSDMDSRLVLGRGCSLDRQPLSTNGGMLVQQ